MHPIVKVFGRIWSDLRSIIHVEADWWSIGVILEPGSRIQQFGRILISRIHFRRLWIHFAGAYHG